MFIRNIYPCLRIVCVCKDALSSSPLSVNAWTLWNTLDVCMCVCVCISGSRKRCLSRPTTELITARLKLIQISINVHNNIIYSEGNLHYIIAAIRRCLYLYSDRPHEKYYNSILEWNPSYTFSCQLSPAAVANNYAFIWDNFFYKRNSTTSRVRRIIIIYIDLIPIYTV